MGRRLVVEPELDGSFHIGQRSVKHPPALCGRGSAQHGVAVGGSEWNPLGDGERSPIILDRYLIVCKLQGAPGHIGHHGMSGVLRRVVLAARVGPVVDNSARVRVVGQPLDHSDSTSSDGNDREPIVGKLGNLHHAGYYSDIATQLSTANLPAAIDEHDPKFVFGCIDAVAN